VVTEYGIAYLHGRTIRQRAESLIEVAHPKFRDQLHEYCEQQRWFQRNAYVMECEGSNVSATAR
jgi:acyl-CoA hydrolase